MASKVNGVECPLKKCCRDRLGLWGDGDSEVPGNVSGQQRLHHKKFNKVRSVLNNLFILEKKVCLSKF